MVACTMIGSYFHVAVHHFLKQRIKIMVDFLLDKCKFLQYFRCLAASRQAVQTVFDFQRTSVERSLSMVRSNIFKFQFSFVNYPSTMTL